MIRATLALLPAACRDTAVARMTLPAVISGTVSVTSTVKLGDRARRSGIVLHFSTGFNHDPFAGETTLVGPQARAAERRFNLVRLLLNDAAENTNPAGSQHAP